MLKLTANCVVQLENAYDKKGQLDTLKDKVTGKNYKYERDDLDNVTAVYEVDDSDVQISSGYGESFTYDDLGNIKKKTIVGPVSQVYDYTYKTHSLHTLESIAIGSVLIKPETDVQGRNRGKSLYINNVKVCEENISYRKVGDHATNMPSTVWFGDKTKGTYQIKDSVRYAYDKMGNIEKVYENGELAIRYQYDALNRLVREDNKTLDKTYDAWGNVSVVDNNGTLISDVNHIGNLNPFRYRGYYYDTETKLYFLKTRYYDPELGRFITIDGIEYLNSETINGLNLYAYCGNNPVSNVDPNGNDFWSWLLGGLSLVGGVILCFVPGGQAIGAALIVGGVSITASNIMTAAGVDSKIASLISSGLDIVAGIALCFVPGMQGLGASLIGSGTLGIAGGYISEALGGSFELGAAIGSIIGGMLGGKIYNSIHYSKIAKQGILIGKMDSFKDAAIERGLAYYNGLPGYKGIEKILGKTLTSKLGWAHNYTYISNVMKYGGTIYNLGGPATGSYGKELALIAKKAYRFVINLF